MALNHDWQDIVIKRYPKLKRRLGKLRGENLKLAEFGIRRHLNFCSKSGIVPDLDAIREIIDDALNGRSIAKSNETENVLNKINTE